MTTPRFALHLLTFLAAFLLFQIELILAKILLPTHGGSYLVWGASLVFFQAVLLLGYLFAHLVLRRVDIARYRYVHLVLMLLPLAMFPGRPLGIRPPSADLPMVWDVFGQLFLSIGPVFFVLSTISLVTQRWLAASTLPERDNPYALYATSNWGSLLGLITYPLYFEETWGLTDQLTLWRSVYGVLIVLQIALMVTLKVGGASPQRGPEEVSLRGSVLWCLWGAAGSVLFLSVTHVLTMTVAPFPLLWVLPLAIYLISFILNFKRVPWCPAWIENRLFIPVATGVFLFFDQSYNTFPFLLLLALHSYVLFHLCMFVQRRLVMSKPRDEKGLTGFYVAISLGSFIGSMIVSWVIPMVSDFLLEYWLGLIVLAVALTVQRGDIPRRVGLFNAILVIGILCVLVLWPLTFKTYHFWGLLALWCALMYAFARLLERPAALAFGLLSIVVMMPFLQVFWNEDPVIHRSRNYYGFYEIVDRGPRRWMFNGTVLHGVQDRREERRRGAIMYYHPSSPVARVLTSEHFQFQDIGVVGLGVGAVAAYGQEGQTMDFFELDPHVESLAREYFTYLKDSQARQRVLIGDARLALDGLPERSYDVLVVDAFSGDAIPAHLLTVEALEKYRRYIREDGIVLFHVSNLYVDLLPVLRSNARQVRAYIGAQGAKGEGEDFLYSEWVAITWDQGRFLTLVTKLKWARVSQLRKVRTARPWTDDYSSLMEVFKTQDAVQGLKNFRLFYW